MRFNLSKGRRARPSVRLQAERLEARDVPAGSVVTAMVDGSLFIFGDAQDNQITIGQVVPGVLTITPNGGTIVDGSSTTVTRSINRDLIIELGAGNDSLTFDLATPITLPRNLAIDYGIFGIGTKTTTTMNASQNMLSVGGSFGIRYANGDVTTTLDNIAVASGLGIHHMVGDSNLTIDNLMGAGHFSSIGGNLVVSNMRGQATNQVRDTNVGMSEVFSNGQSRALDNSAGSTQILNVNNTTPATVGGSIVISNFSGDSAIGDVVADVNVHGSVGVNLGTGNFGTTVAARKATTGPVISGGLRIAGSGKWSGTINLGAPKTGLTVKQSLIVGVGNGDASINIDDVHVLMGTSIATGPGNDLIAIDGKASDVGSVFGGSVMIGTGPGSDSLSINSGAASSAVTEFKGIVLASMGIDDDTLTLATAGKVKFDAHAVFDGRQGTNTKTVTTGNIEGHVPVLINFT
jgi:hypothetical protein